MRSHLAARRSLSWVMGGLGVAVAAVSLVNGFSRPREGDGWGGGLIEAVFAAGPLIAVAVGLRSSQRSIALLTAVAALCLGLLVVFVLVMQLLDPNEILRDRLLNATAAGLYLSAFVLEAPAFARPSVD